MKIEANNLKRQYDLYAKEYEQAALDVLRSGYYVLGPHVQKFEEEWAAYIGSKYCVGVASGLDALQMAFRILHVGVGDEVIVAANAYIACVMGITMNGASPVFVEPDDYFNIDANKIEAAITEKTKAILAVHLFGQACNMTKIMEIAEKYSLKVVEDCAQSHGNQWNGRKVGTFGDIGCFSFYPTKGCGGFGDGGALTTNDEGIYREAKVLRNYGSEKRYYNKVVGMNSRLDELQAALLSVKLKHLDELNEERRTIAKKYMEKIKNSDIELPKIQKEADSTWHQFVVRTPRRDELIQYLSELDIGTIIHYPIPPYLAEAYRYLGKRKGDYPITEKYADESLSIPMFNGIQQDELNYVIECINKF